MKVYVICRLDSSGSFFSSGTEVFIDSVVDSEMKAQSKIRSMADQMLAHNSPDDVYPKIVDEEKTEITIATNGYEDEDYVSFYYTEYEVE